MLTIATCLAENTAGACQAVAGYLAGELGLQVRYEPLGWQAAYSELAHGRLDMAWICGWPYVEFVALSPQSVQLLAAPVFRSKRYEGRPVYFSDVVVRRESPLTSAPDLRSATWAYNEPGSFSGYHVVAGCDISGVGEALRRTGVASGSHLESLRLVRDGLVEAAAIDSTVLEWAAEQSPHQTANLRVVASLGPSPSPPLVAGGHLPEALVRRLQTALATMHSSRAGQKALTGSQVARFEVVEDRAYDAIRTLRVANP